MGHAAPETKGKGIFGLFANGNTSKERREQEEHLAWQPGDYAYTWLPNGMLGSVTRPDGKTITFKYDALGRRMEKTFNGRVHRYLWDGDVILHEWEYNEAERPQPIVSENGEMSFDRPEPTNNLVTWVYDPDSYVPTAKLVGGKRYSIVSDYIGRPVQAYDERGTLVWQANYDIYGNLLNLKGDRGFVPFRQLGQYEDGETGLYYNRFKYYDPRTGGYVSQDPIGLAGNNPTLYEYVYNPNGLQDVFGLSEYNAREVLGRKVYQNSTDFVKGTPDYVDSSVHPAIRAKVEAGATNLDLMKAGKAPIGIDGKQINLHHILGQEPGPMIELTQSTHKKYHRQLHGLIEQGRSFRNDSSLAKEYKDFKERYWKERAKQVLNEIRCH